MTVARASMTWKILSLPWDTSTITSSHRPERRADEQLRSRTARRFRLVVLRYPVQVPEHRAERVLTCHTVLVGTVRVLDLHADTVAPKRATRPPSPRRNRYQAEGVPIHLVGVELSQESRSVVAFETETLAPAR